MHQARERITLQSDEALLVFDLGGGGIVGFSLTAADAPSRDLTPLAWNMPGEHELEPREMAHFVVLDRWANPTEAEARNGMTFHGEATHVHWLVEQAPAVRDGVATATVSAGLPLAGLRLVRTMRLQGAVLTVEDRITNNNPLGRAFNMIQHATLGPPFLDEQVLVDTKVTKGFTQGLELRTPIPESPVVSWPEFDYEDHAVDMRRLTDYAGPLVTSYIFADDQKNGWVTACNPARQLMIGYLWETRDFPWLSFWRHVVDGKPLARGLEFGTTGLLQPFPVLARKGQIFGRQLLEWIDAGETITKRFTAFLAAIPSDFSGVADVRQADGSISVIESSERGRRIAIHSPEV